jgi:hypothetical protein
MSENLLRATVVSASGNLAGLKHRAAQVPDTHQVVCGTGLGFVTYLYPPLAYHLFFPYIAVASALGKYH